MVFTNISVISLRSVLLGMEETGVPGENHRPAASLSVCLSLAILVICFRPVHQN